MRAGRLTAYAARRPLHPTLFERAAREAVWMGPPSASRAGVTDNGQDAYSLQDVIPKCFQRAPMASGAQAPSREHAYGRRPQVACLHVPEQSSRGRRCSFQRQVLTLSDRASGASSRSLVFSPWRVSQLRAPLMCGRDLPVPAAANAGERSVTRPRPVAKCSRRSSFFVLAWESTTTRLEISFNQSA